MTDINQMTLEQLEETIRSCTLCQLHQGRNNAVPGEGPANADIMFIGEGPGFHEDRQGRPFVGAAGQFLEELLASINMTREQVYIGNVVKCRPPKNRDPRPDEIESCKGYLRSQLRLIQPKVVVTLGNFASKLLLRTDTGITRLRGSAYEWWGRFLVPTYHPAAALRGSARVLGEMREDFETVQAIIEGKLQRRRPEPTPEEAAATDSNPEQLDLFS